MENIVQYEVEKSEKLRNKNPKEDTEIIFVRLKRKFWTVQIFFKNVFRYRLSFAFFSQNIFLRIFFLMIYVSHNTYSTLFIQN